VLSKVATLQEIDTHWSLNDVVDANVLLNLQQELENNMLDRVNKNG
jgi:hypothetical protein